MVDISTWRQTSSYISIFSAACGAVASAFYKFGPKEVHHSRRNLGKILQCAAGEETLCTQRSDGIQPVVYLIFSIWHHHKYIGSTINLCRRTKEHYRMAAGIGKPNDKDMQRVHRCMRDFGGYSFGILPLCVTSAEELRQVEKVYIKQYQPTLNVMHTGRGLMQMRMRARISWDQTSEEVVAPRLHFFKTKNCTHTRDVGIPWYCSTAISWKSFDAAHSEGIKNFHSRTRCSWTVPFFQKPTYYVATSTPTSRPIWQPSFQNIVQDQYKLC